MKRRVRQSTRVETLELRKLLSHYFVSTQGSDSNPGTNDQPWGSLQWAAHNVVAGDTVTVRAGDYIGFSLSWDFPQNGTADHPISFLADPGVTINRRNPKTADGIDFEGSSYVIIDGFNIAPTTTEDVWRAGIRAAGGGVGNIIRNNTVTMRSTDRYGIFSSFSSHLTVEKNNVSGTNNSGIYTSNSADHPTIRANTVHNTGGNGIHFNGDISQGGDGLITYALVEDNVVYDVGGVVGGSAINMDGIQYSRIQNNLLYNNHAKGITLYHIDAADGSKYNIVANNTVVQAPGATGYALSIKTESTFNSVFNNILIGGTGFSGAMNVSYDSLLGLFSDYNVVQNAFSLDDGTSNMSLSAWRADRLLDLHSSLGTVESLFVDPANRDYHLLANSPAVNAGMNFSIDLQAPTDDITGAVRPNGQNWDAGAYEYIGPADTTPPAISSLVVSNIRPGRFTISWTTSKPSTGQIEYGTSDGYGTLSPIQNVLLLTHTITVNGLSPETLYHFRVVSGDVVGNVGMSADQQVTTLPPDLTPPQLTGIGAGVIAPVYAYVTWSSDEPADSIVEFGTTSDYGSSVSDSVLIQDHKLKLTGLQPSTTYHFRIKSRDESLNQAVSQDFTSTTSAVGQFPSGVVGYWTFGEYKGPATQDSSGHSHTGTAQNGPEYVPGVSGNALNFDGDNDSVRVPRSSDLESAAVTVSAWVKLAEGTQAPWAVIAKKTFANDGYLPYGSYALSLSPNGLGNLVTFYTGHTSATNELNSPNPIPTGRWVFLAGTFDPATGKKCLYIDGELAATNTVAQPIAYDNTSSGDLYFGQDPGPGEAFSGFIDSVAIWDRPLSASEIATLAYIPPATSIIGTSGDDTIHLTLTGPSQLIVQVNGNAPYTLDPSLISELQIDGLGGNDTLTFTATSGNDVTLFSARGLTCQSVPMPITHRNVETVLFDSAGGSDVLYVSSDATVGLASDATLIGLDIVSSAQLDIRDKKLTLDYGVSTPTPMDGVEYLIRNARDGGAWDHAGISSSLANAGTYTVAAFDDLPAGKITVRLTRYGDTNNDGVVDIRDLFTLVSNWRQSTTHFANGDFNSDGTVDSWDLTLLSANWQASSAAAGAALISALGLAPIIAAHPPAQPDPAPADSQPPVTNDSPPATVQQPEPETNTLPPAPAIPEPQPVLPAETPATESETPAPVEDDSPTTPTAATPATDETTAPATSPQSSPQQSPYRGGSCGGKSASPFFAPKAPTPPFKPFVPPPPPPPPLMPKPTVSSNHCTPVPPAPTAPGKYAPAAQQVSVQMDKKEDPKKSCGSKR